MPLDAFAAFLFMFYGVSHRKTDRLAALLASVLAVLIAGTALVENMR